MNFRKIELSDKSWVDELLKYSDFKGSEYCFANNFNWRNVYNIEIARYKDYGVLRNNGREKNFLFPFGKGNLKEVIEELLEICKEDNIPFGMFGICGEEKVKLEETFPDFFEFEEQRDYEDYIYLSEKLIDLSGKKLHSKRNHINYFLSEHSDWQYEEITKENMQDAIDMSINWCSLNDVEESKDKKEEIESVKSAFKHFEELGLKGGLIRLDGEVIAYSIGERLSSDTFIVHIEKAYSQIRGAYPLINQQFVLHNCKDFLYVNREEDTGDLGLRKAKLSYKPEILLTKYYATVKK
ncbi:MAG: phosphatidylglycerol lysyltransferase domain-containing protein [Oscillospiraceae bacterium]